MYSFGVLALNLLSPPNPADYPRTDASVITDLALGWVALLMHEQPCDRPTAMALQAEPYFEVDKVLEQRAHDAEAAEVRAKAIAATKHDEAVKEVAKARADAEREVQAAKQQAERAQKQATDTQTEADTKIAAAAVAEAKKREAAAEATQKAADERVRQVH